MNTQHDTDKGICILSLDSGGTGSYSQLMLVNNHMRTIAGADTREVDVRPADRFDIMGGVGFGGIAAFMLGHLRLTVDEAEDLLLAIALAVFPGDADMSQMPEVNMQRLRVAIEDMLKGKRIPLDAKFHDQNRQPPNCKVAIYAATSANISHPCVFRTYAKSKHNPTVVEALCATMASPSLFSPVKIGPRLREQEFIGSPLGAANPTHELLKEATLVFGDDKRVAQVVSLGAGQPRTLSFTSMTSEEVAGQLLKTLITDCEVVAAQLSTRLFGIDAYVRFNVPLEMGGSSMDDWRDLASIECRTSAYIETATVRCTMEKSAQYMRSRVGTATLSQINQLGTSATLVKTVPSVSPYYVVRQQEWDLIVRHLIDTPSPTQKIFCITGMGGCGKTQLVSYFLQEKGNRYRHVVFVDSSSLSSIKADLQVWAQSLGPGHKQDVWDDAMRNLASDYNSDEWVLVLDNADDPNLDLAPFLPQCHHGTIIITSRNRDVGDISNSQNLELGEMTPNEALSTLLKSAQRQIPGSPEETKSARSVAKLLGYLPVALVQAGTYCAQASASQSRPFSFAEYAALFSTKRSGLMKRITPASLDNYQLSAYASFDISYKDIPKDAKDFFHFASSFTYAYISLAMFATAVERKFSDPQKLLPRATDHKKVVYELAKLLSVDGKWSEIRMHRAIHTLRSFSLITASSLGGIVYLHMHPLVHAWARDISPPILQNCRRMATQVIVSCVNDKSQHLYRRLIPHIHDMLDTLKQKISHVNDQFAVAVILKKQGYEGIAEHLLKVVLETLKVNEGHASARNLVTEWLAQIYRANGDLNAAERLGREALAYEVLINENSEQAMWAAGNHAVTLNAQGKHVEAEEINLWIMKKRREELGDEHEDTTLAEANMAHTLWKQGRYAEAEELEKCVVKKEVNRVGEDHRDAITAWSLLAMTYHHQRRWNEAETLLMDALERARKVLGNEDPITMDCIQNLASTYGHQGRNKEAEELELELVRLRTKVHGPEHIRTIETISNLAVSYLQQEEWAKAKLLLLKMIPISLRILGKENILTKDRVMNLWICLSNLGKPYEARKTLELLR